MDLIIENNTEFIKKTRAAIFDMDGTIVDSMPYWARSTGRFFERCGIRCTEEEWKKCMEVPIVQTCGYIAEAYGIDVTPGQMADFINREMDRCYRDEIPLKEGADRVIRLLHEKGIPLYIATSSSRSQIEIMLDRHGLKDCFRGLFPVAEYGTDKFSSDIFRIIADQAGCHTSELPVFEDALYAMESASRAGCPVIGIRDDFEEDNRDKIMELADIYVDKPLQLLGIFKQNL